jgi:hypothetical protein
MTHQHKRFMENRKEYALKTDLCRLHTRVHVSGPLIGTIVIINHLFQILKCNDLSHSCKLPTKFVK